MPIDREEFRWRSGYGVVKTIDEIDDEHLSNIVLHTSVRYPKYYGADMKLFLKEELLARGIKPKTVELPHRDDAGGWAKWDTDLRELQFASDEEVMDMLVQFFRSTTHYTLRLEC